MSKLIAFSGKAQAGKSLAAEYLGYEGYQTVSFAGGVKQEVERFLHKYDIPVFHKHLYGSRHDKEELLCFHYYRRAVAQFPEFLEFVHQHIGTDMTAYDFLFTPRSLLQWWGVHRRAQDKNHWCDIAEAHITELMRSGVDVVVDDCRFENEVDMIHRLGGKVYRITRPWAARIQGASHESETALDEYMGFDGRITNEDIVDFRDAVLDPALA